jgi:hypothetical protein
MPPILPQLAAVGKRHGARQGHGAGAAVATEPTTTQATAGRSKASKFYLLAVEATGTSRVDSSDLRSLRAFIEERRPQAAIVVRNEQRARVHDGIDVLPWREFLGRLWSGAMLS